MQKMNWENLLSLKRYGDKNKRLRSEQDPTRLGFDVDFDRIIFSPAFRSLQDKTQVIPFSKTDFVHTRLTHSLEVSVVARSLGRLVGKQILQKHQYLSEVHGYESNDFGAIVSVAALAHDIGNPPFGHSGEKAIGEFFSIGEGKKFEKFLTPKQWQDLIDFEGNANGFALLVNDQPGNAGGLRLSYATLGTFLKYPKESLPKKPTKNIADKKFGVFQNNVDFFKDLTQELGMLSIEGNDYRFHRHPLAFLVEAADDICYTIIDFEDGINLGWIPEDYALEYFIKLVKNTIDKKKYGVLKTTEERMSYLRALAIGNLIQDAADIFMNNEEAIMSGNFHMSLMDKSQYLAQMQDIIKISVERIYQSPEVTQKEIKGYQIIHHLLAHLTQAVMNYENHSLSTLDKLILRHVPKKYYEDKPSVYDKLMGVCFYVSMLTDSKAQTINQLLSKN